MTLEEKQSIAAAARRLILLLQDCDDEEFVDSVVGCVTDGDWLPLLPEYI